MKFLEMFDAPPKYEVSIEHMEEISPYCWNDLLLNAQILKEIKKHGTIPPIREQVIFSRDFDVIKHSVDFSISWTAPELSLNAQQEFAQWCEFCNLSSNDISEIFEIVKPQIADRNTNKIPPCVRPDSKSLIDERVAKAIPSIFVSFLLGLIPAIAFTFLVGNSLPEKYTQWGQIGLILAGSGIAFYATLPRTD